MAAAITAEMKEAALRAAVAHSPIVESDILARFLEFVGTEAIHGDGGHLKEYVIATKVFHKSQDFDPRHDPIVRVHARRLRAKLDEYYRDAGASDPVRLFLPKGGYLPQFVRKKMWCPKMPASSWRWIAAVLAVVVLAQFLVFWRISSNGPTVAGARNEAHASPLLAPLLTSPRRTIIAFGNDLFLKDNDGNMFRLKADEKLDLASRLRIRAEDLLASQALRGAGPYYLDADYTGTGEAVCVFLLTRMFTQWGRPIDVRAADVLNPQELRDSNVIFLGSPRENAILSKVGPEQDFRFVRRINPVGRPFLTIENLRPQKGEQALYEARLHPVSRNPQEVYATISFLPGFAPGTHFLILAGQSTAGTQAACEYLLKPGIMGDLRESWETPSRIPSSYQVLLKTTIRDFAPIRTEYVTHHGKHP